MECASETEGGSPKRKRRKLLEKKKKQECLICEKTFVRYRDLETHMNTHTKEMPHQCEECDISFNAFIKLWEHKQTVHLGANRKCEFCGQELSSVSSLYNHRKNLHKKEWEERRNSGGLQFMEQIEIVLGESAKTSLTEEKKAEMPEMEMNELKNEEEQVCFVNSNASENVERPPLSPLPPPSSHSTQKKRKKKTKRLKFYKKYWKCDICGKAFRSFNEYPLKRHKLTVHRKLLMKDQDSTINSELGNDILDQKSDLDGGDKTKLLWTCDICGRTFLTPNSYSLMRHKRTVHASTNQFCRCEICGEILYDNFCLKRHLQNIHGSKIVQIKIKPKRRKRPKGPLSCEICGSTFPDNYKLNRHMQVHTNSKVCKCEICGETLRDKYCLRKHKAIEHGEFQKKKSWMLPSQLDRTGRGKENARYLENVHGLNQAGSGALLDTSTDEEKLDVQLETHDNWKDRQCWKCEICGKVFISKDRQSLNQHLRIQHFVDPLLYHVTPYSPPPYHIQKKVVPLKKLSLKGKGSVQNVRKRNQYYDCDICGKVFYSSSAYNLNRHKRNVHFSSHETALEQHNEDILSISTDDLESKTDDEEQEDDFAHLPIPASPCEVPDDFMVNPPFKQFNLPFANRSNQKPSDPSFFLHMGRYSLQDSISAPPVIVVPQKKVQKDAQYVPEEKRIENEINNVQEVVETGSRTCHKCGKVLATTWGLTRHLKIKDCVKLRQLQENRVNALRYVCGFCNKDFRDRRYHLIRHLASWHRYHESEHATLSEEQMAKHRTGRRVWNDYSCAFCKLKSLCRRTIEAHILNRHLNKLGIPLEKMVPEENAGINDEQQNADWRDEDIIVHGTTSPQNLVAETVESVTLTPTFPPENHSSILPQDQLNFAQNQAHGNHGPILQFNSLCNSNENKEVVLSSSSRAGSVSSIEHIICPISPTSMEEPPLPLFNSTLSCYKESFQNGLEQVKEFAENNCTQTTTMATSDCKTESHNNDISLPNSPTTLVRTVKNSSLDTLVLLNRFSIDIVPPTPSIPLNPILFSENEDDEQTSSDSDTGSEVTSAPDEIEQVATKLSALEIHETTQKQDEGALMSRICSTAPNITPVDTVLLPEDRQMPEVMFQFSSTASVEPVSRTNQPSFVPVTEGIFDEMELSYSIPIVHSMQMDSCVAPRGDFMLSEQTTLDFDRAKENDQSTCDSLSEFEVFEAVGIYNEVTTEASNDDTTDTFDEDTAEVSNKDTTDEDTAEVSNKDTTDEDSAESSNQDTSDEDSADTSNENTAETFHENTAETFHENTAETFHKNKAENVYEKTAEICDKYDADICAENSAGTSTDDTEDICNENAPGICYDDVADICNENAPGICHDDVAEICDEDVAEICAENAAGTCNESAADNCPENHAEICPENDTDICVKNTGGTCPENTMDSCTEDEDVVTPETYNENTAEICDEDVAKICAENAAGTCNENPADVCNENSTDICNENSTDICNENPTDICNENPVDICTETPADICNENPADACLKNDTKICLENTVDNCNETSTDTVEGSNKNTSYEDSAETSNDDDDVANICICNENAPEICDDDVADISAENVTGTYTEDARESCNEKVVTTEFGTDNEAAICQENPADICNETPADICTETPADICNENPADICNENPADICTENPADICTENPADICSETSTDICNETPADICTETPTEICLENTMDNCNENVPETYCIEDVAEVSNEDATETCVENVAVSSVSEAICSVKSENEEGAFPSSSDTFSVNGLESFECDKCGKCLANEWSLKMHQTLPSGDCVLMREMEKSPMSEFSSFLCYFCNKDFRCDSRSRSHLVRHIATYHSFQEVLMQKYDCSLQDLGENGFLNPKATCAFCGRSGSYKCIQSHIRNDHHEMLAIPRNLSHLTKEKLKAISNVPILPVETDITEYLEVVLEEEMVDDEDKPPSPLPLATPEDSGVVDGADDDENSSQDSQDEVLEMPVLFPEVRLTTEERTVEEKQETNVTKTESVPWKRQQHKHSFSCKKPVRKMVNWKYPRKRTVQKTCYLCPFCQKNFLDKRIDLIRHIAAVHQRTRRTKNHGQFSCGFCCEKSASIIDLQMHTLQKHSNLLKTENVERNLP